MIAGEIVVTQESAPLGVRAQIGGLQLEAATEPDPPNRLSGLRVYRLSQHVTDQRVAEPPVSSSGPVPEAAAAVAGEAFAELVTANARLLRPIT